MDGVCVLRAGDICGDPGDRRGNRGALGKQVLARCRSAYATRSLAPRSFTVFCDGVPEPFMVGCGRDGPVPRQNVETVQRWLCQQRAFTWVYEADDVADLLEEGGCRRWRLGDADGRCVGSAIWLSEGHVVRVARGHGSLRGLEGDPGRAPWERYAAGASRGGKKVAPAASSNASAGELLHGDGCPLIVGDEQWVSQEVRALTNRRYRRLPTSGQGGACGINALFGTAGPDGLRHADARGFLRRTLGETAEEVRRNCRNFEALEDVVNSAWKHVIKPQAQQHVGPDGRMLGMVAEEERLWQAIKTNTNVLTACLRAVQQDNDAWFVFEQTRCEVASALKNM